MKQVLYNGAAGRVRLVSSALLYRSRCLWDGHEFEDTIVMSIETDDNGRYHASELAVCIDHALPLLVAMEDATYDGETTPVDAAGNRIMYRPVWMYPPLPRCLACGEPDQHEKIRFGRPVNRVMCHRECWTTVAEEVREALLKQTSLLLGDVL